MLEITPAAQGDRDVDALVEAHVARSRKYYPVTSCHSYRTEELLSRGVQLFVGRSSGEAVVIGGFVDLGDGTVEIKSVFTAKHARGQGYGRAMMEHLIALTKQQGGRAVFLETGSDDASAAARAVYEKLGFRYCGPFGDYTDDPLSAYMTATL